MLERANFNTGTKNKIIMNLGAQMADISVSNQKANFNIGPYGDPPLLKNHNFENHSSSYLSWPKLGLEPEFNETGTFGG